MAGHGRLNTIPADPGPRCNGVRGFLLQFPLEDLPPNSASEAASLSKETVSIATNLPF
jgi:hypothetical protein